MHDSGCAAVRSHYDCHSFHGQFTRNCADWWSPNTRPAQKFPRFYPFGLTLILGHG